MARRPGFPSGACRFAAASSAFLCGTGSAATTQPRCGTSPLSLHDRSARHFLRAAVSWSPSIPASPGVFERVEGVIADPSARCGVASPIRGTTLRQRLDPRGCVGRIGLATDVPFRACVFGSLAGCAMRSSAVAEKRMRQPAERA